MLLLCFLGLHMLLCPMHAMAPKQIIAVRHGESEWNVLRQIHSADEDRYNPILYKPDCDMTVLGKQQSRQAGLDLKSKLSGDFTLVVSPLRRALQTACGMLETCQPECYPVETIVHPAATEVLADPCDIGTNTDELELEFPKSNFDLLRRPHWWAFGKSREETWDLMRNNKLGGTETEEMIRQRFQELRFFVKNCNASEAVVIVCHSETIWWLTSRIMKDGQRLGVWTKNGEVLDISSQFLGVNELCQDPTSTCAFDVSRLGPLTAYATTYDSSNSAEI